MGRVNGRLKRLERDALNQRTTIRCPECAKEFSAYGDLALELIVADWRRRNPEECHNETPPGVAAILEHEHDLSDQIPDKPKYVDWSN
jgi:hypothetical protein